MYPPLTHSVQLRLAIGMIRAEAGLPDHLATLLQPTTTRLLQWKALAPGGP